MPVYLDSVEPSMTLRSDRAKVESIRRKWRLVLAFRIRLLNHPEEEMAERSVVIVFCFSCLQHDIHEIERPNDRPIFHFQLF